MLRQVTGLKELIKQYELIMFDIWGVIVEGEPYPGVVDSINFLMKSDVEVRFVSNSMRLQGAINKAMNEIGLECYASQFFTSGQMANDVFLQGRGEPPLVYYISNNSSLNLIPPNVATTADITKANKLLFASQLSTGDDLDIYNDIFKEAISSNIEFICPNPDTIIVNRGIYTYCPGYFAQKYEDMGGKVIYIGKPGRDIFLNAIQSAKVKDLSKVLMVGDTLEMDIVGANRVGIDSALVITGNVGNIATDIQDMGKKANVIRNYCEERTIIPKYIIDICK